MKLTLNRGAIFSPDGVFYVQDLAVEDFSALAVAVVAVAGALFALAADEDAYVDSCFLLILAKNTHFKCSIIDLSFLYLKSQ